MFKRALNWILSMLLLFGVPLFAASFVLIRIQDQVSTFCGVVAFASTFAWVFLLGMTAIITLGIES